jgi:pSer/pThr/pTyr-binding forkhead associated (FHA) protein
MHARIESSHADAQAMATHVVYRGRAVPITAVGLVIGRDPDGAQTLRLPEGVAGLSRRHCTLRHDGARTQLIDHSTHGSFIDGVRVRGRALLTAGTTLRVGTPGIELSLIALGTETH